MAGKWANRKQSLGYTYLGPHPRYSVPYASLTKAFALIEGTTKRLEKTAILTSFLLLVIQRSAKNDPKSLLQSIYLCINRVRTPIHNLIAL